MDACPLEQLSVMGKDGLKRHSVDSRAFNVTHAPFSKPLTLPGLLGRFP